MTKRIILFATTTVVVFFVTYFLNKTFTNNNNVVLSFPLLNVYIFQIIVTLLVYIITEVSLIKLPNETGYVFLGLTMLQFGVFAFFFKNFVFSDEILTKIDKFSIIIPLFLSLFMEVVATVKLMNNIEYGENKKPVKTK